MTNESIREIPNPQAKIVVRAGTAGDYINLSVRDHRPRREWFIHKDVATLIRDVLIERLSDV